MVPGAGWADSDQGLVAPLPGRDKVEAMKADWCEGYTARKPNPNADKRVERALKSTGYGNANLRLIAQVA